MRNKSTGTLSPTVIFLFRLFALVLAALLGAASLNACPTRDKVHACVIGGISHGVIRGIARLLPHPILEPIDALSAHDGICLRRR
jgi:hypothetical protein